MDRRRVVVPPSSGCHSARRRAKARIVQLARVTPLTLSAFVTLWGLSYYLRPHPGVTSDLFPQSGADIVPLGIRLLTRTLSRVFTTIDYKKRRDLRDKYPARRLLFDFLAEGIVVADVPPVNGPTDLLLRNFLLTLGLQ